MLLKQSEFKRAKAHKIDSQHRMRINYECQNKLHTQYASKLNAFSEQTIQLLEKGSKSRWNPVKHSCRLLLPLLCFLLVSINQTALSLPQGWQTVSGDVDYHVDGNTMTITSGSNKSIVNYQRFDIGKNETVNILLPSSSSSMLNRVIGGNPSHILGSLNSNGQVFLVNPAGVVFGKTATVNVGSLIASSLNISDQNFLSGNYVFQIDESGKGSFIKNEGIIQTADKGLALLLGSTVENSGSIIAPDGTAAIAVGDKVTLNMGENHAVKVTVDEAVKEAVENFTDALTQSGNIHAKSAELIAKVDQAAYSNVVNQSGNIRAQSISHEGGKIRILGTSTDSEAPAIVNNTGTIDASGTTGGEIDITGGTVTHEGLLIADASIAQTSDTVTDASFAGTINIDSSQLTHIKQNGEISAKATVSEGHGGEIKIWSDGNTVSESGSKIDASAGIVSGDGGEIEISAQHTVFFAGEATASAPGGEAGSLLIDPTDIRIQAGGPIGNLLVNANDPNNNGGDSIFDAASFNGFSNVTLQATRDIFVETPWNLNNITSGNALTLEAGRDINIQAAVTTNGGDINLLADKTLLGTTSDNVGGINITAAGSLNSNGGDILLSGATLNIDNTVQTGAGGNYGNVQILPSTNSPDITLAGATDNNDLAGTRFDLSDAEMGRIIADTLLVGSSSISNNIQLLGNIDVTGLTGTGGNFHLGFNTQGNFIGTGHTIDLGSIEQYLDFSGTNQYIAIGPDTANGLKYTMANEIDELTVVTWMKMDNYQRSSMVDFDRSEFWSFGVNFANTGGNDGKLSFDTYATSGGVKDFASSVRVDDGVWHMLTARYDNSIVNDKALFIDGVLDSEVDDYNLGVGLGKNITRYGFVGDGSEAGSFDNGQNNTYFRGQMKGVQIYDRALSNAEIAALNTSGPSTVGDPNLVLAYDFTSATGSSVTDLSGNGYTGVLKNNPTFQSGHDLSINVGGNINTGAIISDGRTVDIKADNNIIVDGSLTGITKLTADADLNNTGILQVGASINSQNKDLTLIGSQIDIDQNINSGTGNIIIKSSVAKNMTLGDSNADNDSAVQFDISDIELSRLSTDILTVGDLNQNSPITLNGNILLNTYDLSLLTGSTFDGNGFGINTGRSALQLDGTSGYLAIEDIFYNNPGIDELTISAWIKTTDTQGTILDFDRSEHYSLGIAFVAGQTPGTVSWDTTGGGVTHDMESTVLVNDNKWHFITATFDKSLLNDKSIYLDGVLDGQANGHNTNAQLGTNNTRYGFIGDGSEATSYNNSRNDVYYSGLLDEIRVYDKALNATEIAALYNNGQGLPGSGPEANLVMGYNFDEGGGSVANDFSGNGYNANLFGGAQFTSSSNNVTIQAGGAIKDVEITNPNDSAVIDIQANLNGVGGNLTGIYNSNEIINLSPGSSLLVDGNANLSFEAQPDPPVVTTGISNPDPGRLLHDNNLIEFKSGSEISPVPSTPLIAFGDIEPQNNSGFIDVSLSDATPSGIELKPAFEAYSNGSKSYINKNSDTLYALSPDKNKVLIIDSKNLTVTGEINVGKDPAELITSANGFAYVTNRQDNTVSVINTDTHQEVSTISVGKTPRGLTTFGRQLFVANFGDNTISVIDMKTEKVTKTISTGKKPLDLRISPDGRTLYVANYGGNTISVIDISTDEYSVIQTIEVNKNPKSIVLSPDGKQLYVLSTGSNTIEIIDTQTFSIQKTTSVDTRSYGLSTDSSGRIYVANRLNNKISVHQNNLSGQIINIQASTLLPKKAVSQSSLFKRIVSRLHGILSRANP